MYCLACSKPISVGSKTFGDYHATKSKKHAANVARMKEEESRKKRKLDAGLFHAWEMPILLHLSFQTHSGPLK
jgi:hypothetical protein